MAKTTNPLQREQIGVAATLPGARLQVGQTNAALQLADALKDATPEARAYMQGVAEDKAAKANAQAKQDAIRNAGQPLAEAVRAGKIDATQNPWYMQAYHRESSSIRSLDALQKLQTESASWDTYNDPDKFAAQWREQVGKLAGETATDKDSEAGFQAAQGQVTSQVLQENVARNIARIKTERVQNLGALTADSLQSAYRSNGGLLSPNQAATSIQAAQQQWFATGGSEADWHDILVKSVTNLAYATQDPSLLDLLKAPELLHGPSEAGNGVAGVGSQDHSDFTPPTIKSIDPDAASGTPRVSISAASTKLASPVPAGFATTSGFGQRSRPKAGASTNHRGKDIGTPVGTPVSAQATGKVLSAQDEGKLGNTVRVDYGNGVVGVYGHLSAMEVKPGDVVAPGQLVAKTGATGNVTGPHLHYQLMVNGKATNPDTYTGTVGGTFEADASQEAKSYPGFPTGTDQPFQANGVTPGNVMNRGPSLYGMPGVADQVESDRYRISEAAAAAPLQRARVMKAQREARGYEASDVLWQQYGTGLLTGHVTRDQILKTLGDKGYSGPEIAEAIHQVSGDLRDSVGVAQAQVAAKSQNPGNALEVLDTVSDAKRNGWTPQLQSRVGALILSGDISGDDGQQIIGSAVAQSKAQQSENRAQARFEDQQAAANGGIRNYKDLRTRAGFLRDLVIQTVANQNPAKAANVRSAKTQKAVLDRISNAMGAWLSANPDDFAGALQAAKDAANKQIIETMGQLPRPSSTPKPAAGGNPRR